MISRQVCATDMSAIHLNTIRYTKDVLYPVGHLSLLSPEDALESCEVSKTSEQSVNKRLLNMSATPADDMQTSPAWNCDRKYTTFF